MIFAPRSSPARTRAFVRELGVVGIALAFTIVGGVVSVEASATGGGLSPFAANAHSVPCTPSALSETAATSKKSYGPGSLVTMMASIHNTSTRVCSVSIGAISPSFIVTNSSGVKVWGSCGVNSQFGACALYLMLENLKPGGTYTKVATWNQRSSPTATRVPTGVYKLTTHFDGVNGRASTRFSLTAVISSPTVRVTQGDSGQSYVLHRGTLLVVQLSGPTIYTWTEPASSNSAVLQRTGGSSGNAVTATFVAEAKGAARVTAFDNPNCYPLCLPPTQLFTLNVSVVN